MNPNSPIKYDFSLKSLDWKQLQELYRLVNVDKRDLAKLQRSFKNSAVTCIAYKKSTIVGVGRATSDGEHYGAIFDLAVHPQFQKQGLGRKIMIQLEKKLENHTILLTSNLENEEFYRKLGYKKHKRVLAKPPSSPIRGARKFIEERI